jgi:ABC-type Fe3+ transport system substrate-binding protein
MKKIAYFLTVVLTIFTLMPSFTLAAPGKAKAPQTKAKVALPQVPITYPGDTDQTVIRRAKLVEEAKKEGVVVWWGDLKPNEANPIIAEFNKAYPFIKIEFARQASDEKAAQLEAEFAAGQVSADVMEGGGRPNFPRWREIGLIEKFTDMIPNIGKIPKTMYSRYGDWAMAGNNAIVPMYNTKLVSAAEAPKKWEDLLNPKWKGQMAMTTDMKVWAVFALAPNGWGMKKTEDFLTKLKKQEIIWAAGGHTGGHSLLIAGDFKILIEDYLYHCLQSQILKKAPVNWIKVSPVPITGQSVTKMGHSPHPNAAKLFLEWLFSPTGLKAYESTTQRGAIFKGAGTIQSKLLEGSTLMPRTEDMELEMSKLGIMDKFAAILGVKASY